MLAIILQSGHNAPVGHNVLAHVITMIIKPSPCDP